MGTVKNPTALAKAIMTMTALPHEAREMLNCQWQAAKSWRDRRVGLWAMRAVSQDTITTRLSLGASNATDSDHGWSRAEKEVGVW
jgi:uncharacterized protein (DUF2236 family)